MSPVKAACGCATSSSKSAGIRKSWAPMWKRFHIGAQLFRMPADFDDEVAHPHAAFTGDIRLIPLRRRQIAPHRLKLNEWADFFPGLFKGLPDHHEISG